MVDDEYNVLASFDVILKVAFVNWLISLIQIILVLIIRTMNLEYYRLVTQYKIRIYMLYNAWLIAV